MIDTNVILLAGTKVSSVPDELLKCFENCILFLKGMIDSGDTVLIDDSGLILREYDNVFRVNAYPNNATIFYEYLMGNLVFQHIEERKDYTYFPYPESDELKGFDRADRKFISVAFGYKHKIPIVEATDSKWWGIKNELRKFGIDIVFVDEDYIMDKYQQKMGKLTISENWDETIS